MIRKLQFAVSIILLLSDICWVKTEKKSELNISELIIKQAYFENNNEFKIIVDEGSNNEGERLIRVFENSIIISDTLSNQVYEYDFK